MSGATPSPKVLIELGLADARLTPFESGLINDSWRAETASGDSVVLQRVNPMFPATINKDIDLVTKHLERKGVFTPRIVPTPEGELGLVTSGEMWRLLTFIPGRTREILENPRQADEAGDLLARFHVALSDLDHDLVNTRLGVHDTPLHLESLKSALQEQKDHARYAEIKPLGERILDIAGTLPELPSTTDRIVHGDPKISNIVFDEITDDAICLIDLDTIAPMPIILELGDAFRSWCNPQGEEHEETAFSLPLFRSAVTGYARQAREFLTEMEWQALPTATLTITVELAARFATDTLLESYFGWDSDRYQTAGEHNLVRAKSQLSLAESIRAQCAALEEVIGAAVGS